MNIAVQRDGISLATKPVMTKPGDFITFRAEMDCIISLSACPQDIVKIQSGLENKPKDVEYTILEQSFDEFKVKETWVPIYDNKN